MRLGLVMIALAGCTEYGLSPGAELYGVPVECGTPEYFPAEESPIETCADTPGTFTPVVEWGAGEGKASRSTVAVADLDRDGMPEIIANFTGLFPSSKGELWVLKGDGSGTLWSKPAASLGYASGPVVGDVDRDGSPEIYVVVALGSQLPTVQASYRVDRYSATGNLDWSSAAYDMKDFDYATGLILSDMDHDGEVELVAGRVILKAKDGTLRGKGIFGRGSYGEMPGLGGSNVSESSVPAVADLDLDGVEELITGNTMYTPDGTVKWYDALGYDAMIGIANLDDDPEGEFVAVSFNTIRAHNHDGSILWGPLTIETGNILAPPAIADIDEDGRPEIVTAGGNEIVAYNHDGSVLWTGVVTDETGATGASIFDFEGDGHLEVVYIDEEEMVAYDGRTGAVKFYSDEHDSDTMMDYPVIADVDADGQAEIVVAHAGMGRGISIYGDAGESWGPARPIWNQHAYSINNINDDLTIPKDPEPSFSTHNTWHSAIDPRYLRAGLKEVTAEILETCDVDCGRGTYYLLGRVINKSEMELPAGVSASVYADHGGVRTLLGTETTKDPIPSGLSGEVLTFAVDANAVRGADQVLLVADDAGNAYGLYLECNEDDNTVAIEGPFCEE